MRASAIAMCLAAASLAVPAAVTAAPPQPTSGSAIVDGRTGDWDLPGDSFAAMRRIWAAAKMLECRAYLRYDCDQQTLFVLVLAEQGLAGRGDSPGAETASWVAVGAPGGRRVDSRAGNDGIPPDFAWVDAGFDGNPMHVRGFEASFPIAPTNARIYIHQSPFDAVTASTSYVSPQIGTQMILSCTTAIEPTTWSQLKILYR